MTPVEVWTAVLQRLRESLPESTMDLWITPARAVAIEDGRLVCEFPVDRFAWTHRRYGPILGELVRRVSDLEGITMRSAA